MGFHALGLCRKLNLMCKRVLALVSFVVLKGSEFNRFLRLYSKLPAQKEKIIRIRIDNPRPSGPITCSARQVNTVTRPVRRAVTIFPLKFYLVLFLHG